MTPPALDRAVKRCLAKDPDNRWQSARDLSQELKWIAESGSQTAASVTVVGRSKLKASLPWIAAAILALTTLAPLWTSACSEAQTDGWLEMFAFCGARQRKRPSGRDLLSPCRPTGGVSPSWPRPKARHSSGCARSIRPPPKRSPTRRMPSRPSGRPIAGFLGSSHVAG